LCGSWQGLDGEGASGDILVVGARDVYMHVHSRDWISLDDE
jgi:hypothetical protein